MGTEEDAIRLTNRFFCFIFLHSVAQIAQLAHHLLQLFLQLRGLGFDGGGGFKHQRLCRIHLF